MILAFTALDTIYKTCGKYLDGSPEPSLLDGLPCLQLRLVEPLSVQTDSLKGQCHEEQLLSQDSNIFDIYSVSLKPVYSNCFFVVKKYFF